MQHCGSWAFADEDGNLSRYFCGHRACSRQNCRHMYAWGRIRLVSALVDEYGLNKFFTLTLDTSVIGKDVDPWRYVVEVWSKARKRLRRIWGETKYVAILERHVSGYPHIHGFTNLWLEQRRWSEIWESCGGGKVVWIERVKDCAGAGEYIGKELKVAKYVGKENLAGVPYREGMRTLWRSKRLKAKFELDTRKNYSIIKENIYDVNGDLTWRGKQVKETINGKDEF